MKHLSIGPRIRSVLLYLVVVCSIFWVYGNLVNHPFHTFDDPGYVTDNDYVLDGITTEGLVWAFTNLDMANWHPLTWVSHMVDVELFGNKPAGHYFTNIVAHIIASVLLFRFVHKLSGSELMGFWTAIIWAVHPTNVECVAWIAERKTILSLLFMFAGGLFYLQYRAGGSRMAYLICVVFGLCSSMAKPIAVLFPVMLVLVDCLKDARVDSMNESRSGFYIDRLWYWIRPHWFGLYEKIPFVLIAGGVSVVTIIAQHELGATGYSFSLSLLWRCGNALQSLWEYTLKVFSMPDSSLFYILRELDFVNVVCGGVVLSVMVLSFMKYFRSHRFISFGFAWFLVMFIPTIGLLQVGSQRMADRYLGLPLIGMLFAFCYVMYSFCPRTVSRKFIHISLAAWCIGLAFQSKALCLEWSDDLNLSVHAMKIGGTSTSMLTNAGVSHLQRKNFVAARKSFSLCPDANRMILNLALVDLGEEKYDEALLKVQQLLASEKERLKASILIAIVYDKMGKPADAVRAYKAAISYLPAKRTFRHHVELWRGALPGALAEAIEKSKLRERTYESENTNRDVKSASSQIDATRK